MLELKNITKSFGNHVVLDNFSYIFKDKGLVTVSGPSGRGKTTLFRIISGIDNDFSGEVIRNNITVSYSFQEPRLFLWLDVRKNLEIINNDKEKIDFLLEYVNLTEYQKYRISELSGGMKQRLSLIRALLYPSTVVLLDEPFKELDEELHKKIYNLVIEESKNKLVIVITHDKNDFSNEHIEL